MTRDEILALEGEALDKAVAEVRNDPPRFYIMAMNETEEAYCANVSSDGPWYSERELREWLGGEHERGRLLGHHIVKRQKYARYSQDSSGLFLVLLEELRGEFDKLCDRRYVDGGQRILYPYWHIVNVPGGLWSIQIRAETASDSRSILGPVRNGSLAVAVCRAYLLFRAKEKENEQCNL